MTQRTYNVQFHPAEQTDGGFRYCPTDDPEYKGRLVASSFDSLEAQVRNLAKQLGHHVACYVSIPRGDRKPPRFDALQTRLQFIVYAPKEVA